MNATQGTNNLLVWLGILAVVMPLHVLLHACFLRAACTLYNKIVCGPQGSNSVPEPSFGKATFIMFFLTVAHGFICYAFFEVFLKGRVSISPIEIIIYVLLLPLIFSIVSAIVLWGMLPTSLLRALIVWILENLIALAIGLISGLIVGPLLLLVSHLFKLS